MQDTQDNQSIKKAPFTKGKIALLVFLNISIYCMVVAVFHSSASYPHSSNVGMGVGDFFNSMLQSYFIWAAILAVEALVLRKLAVFVTNFVLVFSPLALVAMFSF